MSIKRPTNSDEAEHQESPITEIPENLTKNMIVTIDIVEKETERQCIVGKVENPPIAVGKPIKTTVTYGSPPVKTITLLDGKYYIRTEHGHLFAFDPTKSFPAHPTH